MITTVVVNVGAALALVLGLGQSAIFTAVASLCSAMLYLAYLGVTVPLLVRRMQRARRHEKETGVDEDGRSLFSLGRWGFAVNAVAVLYQVISGVNLAWPRTEIYDLTGHTWWLRWSALLFIGPTVVVGIAVQLRNRSREGSMFLSSTAAARSVAASPDAPGAIAG